MAHDVKARMVAGAAQLLAKQGLQATSFSDVLELTGAPRGSVYHHFPDGKDQLVADAVRLAGRRALDEIDQWGGQSPQDVTESFIALWRAVLISSDFQSGCAVLAVTVTAESPDLLGHAAEVFRSWRAHLAGLLEIGGMRPQNATAFATTLVASCEGAVVLSRAEHRLEPFELVAGVLVEQVRGMAATLPGQLIRDAAGATTGAYPRGAVEDLRKEWPT